MQSMRHAARSAQSPRHSQNNAISRKSKLFSTTNSARLRSGLHRPLLQQRQSLKEPPCVLGFPPGVRHLEWRRSHRMLSVQACWERFEGQPGDSTRMSGLHVQCREFAGNEACRIFHLGRLMQAQNGKNKTFPTGVAEVNDTSNA